MPHAGGFVWARSGRYSCPALASPSDPTSALPRPQPMPAVFPGRRGEVDQIVELYDGDVLERGAARLVLIHGPEGVGKGRLLADLRKAFVLRGDLVLEGRFTGRQPFDGVAALVSRALTFLDEAGVARPSAAKEIEPLWNPAARPFGAGQSDGRPAAQERLRLFDGVRRFLAELSRIRPVIVLLRDLHVADEGALELFAWLAENLDVDPALAGAVDDLDGDRFRGLLVAAIDDGPAAERLRTEVMPRSPIGAVMALEGLDADGVRAFLSSPEVVERILSSTQGRPDGLRDLLELLPENVSDLSLRRLSRLGDVDREILNLLAVAGRPLPADAVAELSGHPGAVADLVDRRIVRRSVDEGVAYLGLFRPGHADRLIAAVGEERLAALHGRVGGWLAPQAGPPAEIAEHLLSSDNPGAAWPFVDEAVHRLSLTCAFGQAADLLGRAMELSPPAADRLRTGLAQLSELHEARGDLDRALFHAGRLKRATPRHERAEVYLRIGRLLTARGDLQRGLRMLDRAGRGRGVVALQLAAARAEARYLQSDLEEAEAICVAALDAPEQGGAVAGLELERMRVRNTLGKVRLAKDSPRAAAELFEQNRAVAVAAGRPREQARALINLGIARLLQDDYDQAGARYHEALLIAEQQGDVVLAAMARGNLAVIAHRRQRFTEALEHYHRCIVDLRKVGDHTQLATAVNNLGDLYLVLGDLERAQRMADFSLAAQSAGGSRYGRACNQLLLGDIAVAQERFARAERCFEIAHAILKDLGGQAAHSLVRLGRMALLCGRSDRARKLAARAVRVSGGDATDVKAAQGLLLGEAAVNDGDLTGAAGRVRLALETFEELGDREGQWRSHLTLARLYRCEGKADRGLHHLEASDRIIAGVAAGLPADLATSYASDPARQASADELSRLRIELGILPQTAADVAGAHDSTLDAVDGDAARSVASERRRRHSRIVGDSPRLHQLFEVIDRIARTDSTVLLHGESGTGKELVAQAIHDTSDRAGSAFVRVNCAAFVQTLLLSELFGHEKGAFTGATARRQGRFELADGGTLFLDEIGDIAPETQVALLRVLQEREFERVGGGGRPLKVDVRVICATNRSLEEMVASGEFRMDLYYRLKGVTVELPPLRERPEDVPLLATHFLADQRRKGASKARSFDDRVLALLASFSWPGNVRELENVVRSVSLFADGDVIGPEDLTMYEELTGGGGGERISTPAPRPMPAVAPADITPARTPTPLVASAPAAGPGQSGTAEQAIVDKVLTEDISLAGMKKRIEMECILQALRETGGNITRAAKLLKMKRPRLSQIIKANIDLDRLAVKEGVLE